MLPEKPRVLVFSGHSADFVFRCGGTLANYARSGSKVRVVITTFGELGESGGAWKAAGDRTKVDIEALKRTRRLEIENAAKILEVETVFLGWGDHPLLFDRDRVQEYIRQLRDFRPDLVLTHPPVDAFNPDHALVSRMVVEALRFAEVDGVQPETPRLPYPEVFFVEPAGVAEVSNFVPDCYVDITEVYELRHRALAEMKTQPFLMETWKKKAMNRASQARSLSGEARPAYSKIEYAEAFKRFTPYIGKLLA